MIEQEEDDDADEEEKEEEDDDKEEDDKVDADWYEAAREEAEEGTEGADNEAACGCCFSFSSSAVISAIASRIRGWKQNQRREKVGKEQNAKKK